MHEKSRSDCAQFTGIAFPCLTVLPAGELCSDEIRHRFKIASGQGMCVVSGTSDSGQACFEP